MEIIRREQVSLRCRCLRVPEQLPDDREAEAGANGDGREAVSQVVEAEVLELGGLAQARPALRDVDQVLAALPPRKDPSRIVSASLREPLEYRYRWRVERNHLGPRLGVRQHEPTPMISCGLIGIESRSTS